MTTAVATTELEAVNVMLAAIGESPINSLTGTLPVDARLGQSTLKEINKEIQSEGWHFNTEIDVTLPIDGSKNINLATNVLRADPNHYDHPDIDAVQIGLKLYNRKKQTFEFDDELKCTVVYFREFTEIPETARRYIMVKAARVFVDRRVGEDGLRTFTQQDEIKARAILMETDLSNADHNMLTGDPTISGVFGTYLPSNALIR